MTTNYCGSTSYLLHIYIISQGRRLTPTGFNVLFYNSRDGGTRTLTPCDTRSLVWSVYQFQHIPEVKVLLYLTLVEPSGVEPLPMDFQSIVRWPPIRQLHKFPYCQRPQPGTGNGIRTRVTCLKGTSPGPLADIPVFIFYYKDNKNIWNIQIFFAIFFAFVG